MKLAHNVKVTVFCKDDDSEDKIRERLLALFPFQIEEERIPLQRQKASTFYDRIIIILEICLAKEKHINQFLANLHEILPERSRQMILSQRESRLDDNLHFFIRLDKDKWLRNEAWVTDGGNCYHINIGIAAFPAKREIALEIVEEMFGV